MSGSRFQARVAASPSRVYSNGVPVMGSFGAGNSRSARTVEKVFRISLFIAGIINILPSVLAFIPEKISKSYGIEIPNVDFELLLRHRAMLLGIVGGIMIYSAIFKKYYSISVTIAFISMVSFIILYLSLNGINTELEKVMKIDLAATIVLLVGFLLFKLKSPKAST